MAPFHRLFHFSLCMIPSSTASSHCPPFSRPAGNLLWPFQLKEALPANPISCDRCDGEGPIKARRAAVGSPIGAQTPLRFDSWLPLSPLRSPLVSLTLPALQRGRGNGCEVCLTPGREGREKGNKPTVVPLLANLPLVFCDCQQQKLIILKKERRGEGEGLHLPSATSCCNTGRACTPTARSDLTESAFGRNFLASNPLQLTRGFCLYCHMIPLRMMMAMMMMTTINNFLRHPRTPYSSR